MKADRARLAPNFVQRDSEGSAPLSYPNLGTREDALSLRGVRCYFFPMSKLAEIEKSVSQLSAEELAELEQIIRKARREKEQAQKPSLRNTDPVSVGTILKPIGTRDEWYSEMLEGRV